MGDEYIRKQDAVNIAESYEVKIDGFCLDDYEYGRDQVAHSIANDLEDIAAADVAPVVHGEWMCVPEMRGTFSSRYYCSKCGKDAIINNSERYVLSDYCPHCGSFNGGENEV